MNRVKKSVLLFLSFANFLAVICVSTIAVRSPFLYNFTDFQSIGHKGIIEQFEQLLNAYLWGQEFSTKGLPSVSYFADKLHLLLNYFGDLIKKETGKIASEFIQLKLMDLAKERIFDTSKSLSEISYELGFKYPQHFTRLFNRYGEPSKSGNDSE